MATVAKSDRTTKITLAAESEGPFDLTFRLFDADTLNVYVDGEPVSYTLSAEFNDGYDDNARITLAEVAGIDSVIVIDPSLVPGRAEDYVNGAGLIENMNIELARVWSSLGDLYRDTRRSARFFDFVSPVALEAGRSILVNADGDGLAMGPTADEIESAQAYAAAAAASAETAAALLTGARPAFDTLAAMLASDIVEVGEHVRTLGHTTVGDGGDALYKKVAWGTGTADGGSLHDCDDESGQMQLVHNRGIKAEWWGVVLPANGVPVDKTDEFNAAFAFAADLSRDSRTDAEASVFFSCEADFLASDTLHLRKTGNSPCEVNVYMPGRIKATTGGVFESHYTGGSGYLSSGVPVAEDENQPPLPLINCRVQRSSVQFGELDCNFLCSGVRYQSSTGTTSSGQDLYHFRKYGHLVLDRSNNALVLRWNNVKQWLLGAVDNDDFDGRMGSGGNILQANYTGDCLAVLQKDFRVWGGHWGWSRTAILLTDIYGNRNAAGEDCYHDGLSTETDYLETSNGSGDVFLYGLHIMQGYGDASEVPRYDNVAIGGPIGIECFNNGNTAYVIGMDIDACTVQMYGAGLRLVECSYISGGTNEFPDDDGEDSDRVVVIDPRMRYYADDSNHPAGGVMSGIPGMTVGVYPRSGYSSFTGDHTAWNKLNQPTGANGTLTFAKFLAYDAAGRTARGLTSGNCDLKIPTLASEDDLVLVVQDMDVLTDNSVVLRDAGGTVSFQMDRGDYVIITADYTGNSDGDWIPGSMVLAAYGDVEARSSSYEVEVRRPISILHSRAVSNEPIERHYKAAGTISRSYDIAGDTLTEEYDGTNLTITPPSGGAVKVAGLLRKGNWNLSSKGAELTIASGSITPDSEQHNVDTEGDTSTDNLDTINASLAHNGALLRIRPASNARQIVVRHGVGNIKCGSNRVLDSVDDVMLLVRDGNDWVMIGLADPSTPPLTFESRAAFATAISAGLAAADGTIVHAGGLAYEALNGATVIPDMDDWLPFGDGYVDHYGPLSTASETTAAIQACADAEAILRFRDTTYTHDDTINLTNLRMRGDGPNCRVILNQSDRPQFSFTNEGVNYSYADVRGIRFSCSTASTNVASCAILFSGDDSLVQRGTIAENYCDGFYSFIKSTKDTHTTAFGEEGAINHMVFGPNHISNVLCAYWFTNGSGTGNSWNGGKISVRDGGSVFRFGGSGDVVGDLVIHGVFPNSPSSGSGTFFTMDASTTYNSNITITACQLDGNIDTVFDVDSATILRGLTYVGNNMGSSAVLNLPLTRDAVIDDDLTSNWRMGRYDTSLASGTNSVDVARVTIAGSRAVRVDVTVTGLLNGTASCASYARYLVCQNGGSALTITEISNDKGKASCPTISVTAHSTTEADVEFEYTAASANSILSTTVEVVGGEFSMERL